MHANDTAALPSRLEALAALAGLSRAAVHSHVAAALHVAVHLRRGGDGRRQVGEIGVFRRTRSGLVQVVPALVVPVAGRRGEPGARLAPPVPSPGLPLLRELLELRDVQLTAALGTGRDERVRP